MDDKTILDELFKYRKDEEMYRLAFGSVSKENEELKEKVASLTRLLDSAKVEDLQRKCDELFFGNVSLSERVDKLVEIVKEQDKTITYLRSEIDKSESLADELAEEYEKEQERILANDEPDGIPV